MTDVVTWLREALDEQEGDARYTLGLMRGVPLSDDVGHALAHAQWMLADVAAKRAILDAYERGLTGHPGPCVNYEGQAPEDHTEWDSCARHLEWSKTTVGEYAVRMLATAYRHHPGYRAEWAPA